MTKGKYIIGKHVSDANVDGKEYAVIEPLPTQNAAGYLNGLEKLFEKARDVRNAKSDDAKAVCQRSFDRHLDKLIEFVEEME